MNGKQKEKPYSFRISDELMLQVRKKIDEENLKIKDMQDRTNLSRKMKELLLNYVNS